jgi:hypothetical protein
MSDNYPSDWDRRRKKVYKRDNYTCQNCGVQGGPYGNAELHAHHGVPISKGGSHKTSNLTTYCKQCHDAIHGRRKAPTAKSRISSTPSKSSGTTKEGQLGLSAGFLTFISMWLVAGSVQNDDVVLIMFVISFIVGSVVFVVFRNKYADD